MRAADRPPSARTQPLTRVPAPPPPYLPQHVELAQAVDALLGVERRKLARRLVARLADVTDPAVDLGHEPRGGQGDKGGAHLWATGGGNTETRRVQGKREFKASFGSPALARQLPQAHPPPPAAPCPGRAPARACAAAAGARP